MSKKIKFIVIEENTIAYFDERYWHGWASVLKSSILKGGSGEEGITCYKGKKYRDATRKDFESFNLNWETYNNDPKHYEEIKNE